MYKILKTAGNIEYQKTDKWGFKVKFQTMKSLGKYKGYGSILLDSSLIQVKTKYTYQILIWVLLRAISMQHWQGSGIWARRYG